jgi:hypothetical protein
MNHCYTKRWKIECLFRHLKTDGYNLEDLNLRDADKNLLMLAIVATTYIPTIREGTKRKHLIPKNRYADGGQWLETFIFREGLAVLTAKRYQFIEFLKYVLNALSPKNHAHLKNIQFYAIQHRTIKDIINVKLILACTIIIVYFIK